jgi:hypothetical protein
MIFVDFGDVLVSKRLADGDVVSATITDLVDPNETQIALELADHKTWWKGVQALDNSDGQIGFLEVQDKNKGPVELSVRSGDIEVGGKLCLWKAKTFGVHTPMYVIADMERLKGKRCVFRWIAD